MTEEEVVNVRGGEISDSGDGDQHKIKGEHCNGVSQENGSVGGEIAGDNSGEVVAGNGGGDSDASDLVVVDEKVEGKALGESDVAVSEAAEAECECEAVNNNEENDCEEKTEISNGTIPVGGDGQNDEGSVVVSDVSGDKNDVHVTDANKIHDREFCAQNGVENEIRHGVDGVNVADADGIQQDGEIRGDENGVSGDEKKDSVTVVEGDDADVNNGELESVAVENCVMNKEESEIPVAVGGVSATTDVKECADEDDQSKSAEKVQIESVGSGGGGEKEDGENAVEGTSESVSDAVSDEKEVVDAVQEVADREFQNVVKEDVQIQNGSADTEQLSECGKKDEIPVAVDGVPADTDVKECAGEDTQISSDVEKAKVETASELAVDKSVVGADVLNNSAEPELSNEVPVEGEPGCKGRKLENPEEESGQELVPEGEDSSALSSSDMPDGNIVSDVNDNSVKSEAEPSNITVESEAETSDIAVEREAEPSDLAVEREVSEPSDIAAERGGSEPSHIAAEREAEPSNIEQESEAEPSNIAGESEAEPSNIELESEAEPSNIALESEAKPSNIAVESKAEPSNIAVESEAEPSNIAVESEAEPSAEGELSVECEGGNLGDEETRPTQEGSSAGTLDEQNMGSDVLKRPFYYLIRLPRYDDDENIKDQIKIAFHQVEEKTRIRDAIRAEIQAKKAICKEYGQEFRAATAAERAARDLLKSKRQEMDSVQSTMNRLNNAISVGDIDGKIRNMEHMIEHETLPLKEEKQLIRQIKQLKQNREELSSSMGKQDQSQQSVDHKDSIEENLKQLQLLKKEMELLRSNVQKAEVAAKAARKKYDEECNKLNETSARFKAADDVRQEAYAKLQTLKKQLHEKSKYFWEYKNASKKGQELAAEGKREELQCFCIDQVERIMELWNKNDEFRRDYVRCNTRSTLRRLQTLDGRSLGPDEVPPVIPNALTERASKNNPLVLQSTLEQEKKSTPTESVDMKAEPISKVVVQKTEKSQTTKAKKPAKPAPLEKSVPAISRWGDEPEDTPEEPVRTKEEEDLILKAEKARKEEEAAKLKEKRRLEEIEKAKETMQRKKRNAEKAQQRAALKAQREAEQKEKEREKKARKKERRKAASTETADNTEQESAPVPETVTRSTEDCDPSEKPVEVTKRPQKPSQFTRQTKAKSIPLPLRNRGKRRIQPWMWVLIAVLAVVALFYVGNNSSLRSWLQGSGY